MKIKLSQISTGGRIRKDMGDIEELAESIKNEGLLSPILLMKTGKNRYRLLAGKRRLKAHKLLRLTTIEAIIKERPA